MGAIGDRSAQPRANAASAERDLVVGADRLRCLEAGRGAPLVQLQGLPGLAWTPAQALLAAQFRLFVLDLSALTGWPFDDQRAGRLHALAEPIGQAIASLGLERYSLLGTSLGGQLALWLALRCPERLEALVLESPTALRPAPPNLPGQPPEQPAGLLYADPERHPERLSADPALLAQQAALVAGLRAPDDDPELERRLGELQVPTLALFGTSDRLVPPEAGRRYREKLPNCHFTLVYAAGHAISADRPEAFASLVGDFLERREQFVVTRASGLLQP